MVWLSVWGREDYSITKSVDVFLIESYASAVRWSDIQCPITAAANNNNIIIANNNMLLYNNNYY